MRTLTLELAVSPMRSQTPEAIAERPSARETSNNLNFSDELPALRTRSLLELAMANLSASCDRMNLRAELYVGVGVQSPH